MQVVKWADIAAECDSYKDGFVAVFLKYEGQPTNKKDAKGNPVKVTRTSFAQHFKIPTETFHGWVRNAKDPSFRSSENKASRTAVSHANVAKNMAKKDPGELAAAIERAGPRAMEAVSNELALRKVHPKVDTSRAAKKAANAAAHQFAEPLTKAVKGMLNTISTETMPAVLDELNEELETAISEGGVNAKTLNEIAKAAERLATTAKAGKVFV